MFESMKFMLFTVCILLSSNFLISCNDLPDKKKVNNSVIEKILSFYMHKKDNEYEDSLRFLKENLIYYDIEDLEKIARYSEKTNRNIRKIEFLRAKQIFEKSNFYCLTFSEVLFCSINKMERFSDAFRKNYPLLMTQQHSTENFLNVEDRMNTDESLKIDSQQSQSKNLLAKKSNTAFGSNKIYPYHNAVEFSKKNTNEYLFFKKFFETRHLDYDFIKRFKKRCKKVFVKKDSSETSYKKLNSEEFLIEE